MEDIINKKTTFRFLYFSVFVFYVLSVSCSQEKKLTFAFMGDLHYSLNDIQATDSLVQSVAANLRIEADKPEFMVLTGDFFHAGRGVDISEEAEMAFNNFSRDIGMPFYIAKGNHDSKDHYEKNALPLFSKETASVISRSYYSFDKANCHFIMIDCTEKNLDELLSWLEKDLEAARSNPKIEHIFAAGHDPLWIVARAGFTSAQYAEQVGKLLARYKIDAYFCGHTHNKTVTVRTIGNQPVTQIMDAAVVEKGRLYNLAPFMNHVSAQPADKSRPGILPLEEGHQIFIPESEKQYYWGYQEGSTTSYYVIKVDGKSVQADWHVLGLGVVRSFKWEEPGKLTDLKSPEKPVRDAVAANDLQKISRAWIYSAPWIEKDSVAAPVKINGVQAGTFYINRSRMAGSPFWNKVEIPLGETAVKAIQMNNEISIDNNSEARFGLAHLFLLVQFKDGRFARTNIAPKVLTSFVPSDGYPSFPAAELIESVNPGEPLAKVNLRFENYY